MISFNLTLQPDNYDSHLTPLLLSLSGEHNSIRWWIFLLQWPISLSQTLRHSNTVSSSKTAPKNRLFRASNLLVSNRSYLPLPLSLSLSLSPSPSLSLSLSLSVCACVCHGVAIFNINTLTARVVGAPQMILQPVFSIFPCSPLPSGTCRTPGLSIP